MQVSLNCSNDEMHKIFKVHHLSALMRTDEFPLQIGGVEFSCYMREVQEYHNQEGWRYRVELYGVDKKEEDIRKAKALVNSTKEAHKEAQRKLSELMEEK